MSYTAPFAASLPLLVPWWEKDIAGKGRRGASRSVAFETSFPWRHQPPFSSTWEARCSFGLSRVTHLCGCDPIKASRQRVADKEASGRNVLLQ